MDASRVYLDIPYSLKDEAKKYKIKWDMDKKKWYTAPYNKDLHKLKIVYIDVPFKDKDYVKSNGGCWDVKEKCWYTLAFNTTLTSKFNALNEENDNYDYIDELLHNK